MTKTLYGIYGASGFGREVMPLAREFLSRFNTQDYKLVFIDDNPQTDFLNGQEVLTFEKFIEFDAEEKFACLAIADGRIREALFGKLELNRVNHWSIEAANVVSMDEVLVGENSVLASFVTLTSNIKIGKSFHANIYSYVAHDCVIGDFVTFAPGVKCNGNVVIEDHAYLGTGAIIKQGKPNKPLKIGKGAVIAAGAFVTKNVPEGVTVFGNPAVILSKENLKKR